MTRPMEELLRGMVGSCSRGMTHEANHGINTVMASRMGHPMVNPTAQPIARVIPNVPYGSHAMARYKRYSC